MEHEIKSVSQEMVEKQLERLRSSPLFSHSRRYPLFLDYVVRKTLGGHSDELKERTVGVEVFGRMASYDLNADPIVRVTAGEVRKRLAQYYYQPDHQSELRIELNPGSYVPNFRFVHNVPAPSTPHGADGDGSQPVLEAVNAAATSSDLGTPAAVDMQASLPALTVSLSLALRRAQRWRRTAVLLSVALVLALVGALLPMMHHTSSLDSFWRPVIEANGPVQISVGSVVAMLNENVTAPPPSTVSGHPLASDPIAVSDATALSNIQQVLSLRSKPSSLESSMSTSFSDLQKGPVVLISGFNNQWTMRITDPLRFHFVRVGTDEFTLQDRANPGQRWTVMTATPFVKVTSDYGLVARFHDPLTEQLVVVAAGIGENGTVAASRFLTEERFLAELKQQKLLPRPDQNFEAVIQTEIIAGKPGPPRVLATYIW